MPCPCEALSGARGSLTPARAALRRLEEERQRGGEPEHQGRHRNQAEAQVEQHALRRRRLRVARGPVDVETDPAQDGGHEKLRGRRDARYQDFSHHGDLTSLWYIGRVPTSANADYQNLRA